MVIQNTCPNLSNIVHTDFELGRVIQTVVGADPGITALVASLTDLLNTPLWHTVLVRNDHISRRSRLNSAPHKGLKSHRIAEIVSVNPPLNSVDTVNLYLLPVVLLLLLFLYAVILKLFLHLLSLSLSNLYA